MFPKQNRLNTKKFEYVWKNGRGIPLADFAIKYTPSPTNQVSVVCPKKVANLAVKRNQNKRKVTNAIKDVLKRQPPKTKMSLIVTVKKDMSSIKIKDIEESIKNLFVKNNLID